MNIFPLRTVIRFKFCIELGTLFKIHCGNASPAHRSSYKWNPKSNPLPSIRTWFTQCIFKIKCTVTFLDSESNIGLRFLRKLNHQRPSNCRDCHIGQVGISQPNHACSQFVFSKFMTVSQIAQLSQGKGQS